MGDEGLVSFGQSLSVLEKNVRWTAEDDSFSLPNISY